VKVSYVDFPAQFAAHRDEVMQAVERVLASGAYIMGPEVEAFEHRFAEVSGTKHAISVANGTDAIWLTLMALGIGRGDEVITAPNSFIASAGAIAATGARPVFADVRADYNVDPDAVRAAITPRTRAILPVHLTGRPADMTALCAIAREHGLPLVEDAAQAAGARFDGRAVGSFGRAGCFSLHPLKNLNACGDAGVVTTDDDELARQLRSTRNHGLKNRDECERWAYNSRLDAVQAAILNVRLRHLTEVTRERRETARFYREGLPPEWLPPDENEHEFSVFHTFVLTVPERDRLQAFLEARGVETRVHYPVPLHLQAAAAHLGYRAGEFPVTERLAREILSLPIHNTLTAEQKAHVVGSLVAFRDHATDKVAL
jgi:dTDP-4-amino-4,6-dideoxygalactose transaminase